MLMKVISRSTVFATIIALALASISATSVFAAGLARRNADQNLTAQWKHELTILNMEKFMDSKVVKWDTEWLESKQSSTDKAKESRYATSAVVALKQAENIAAKHPGFNAKGEVTDKAQATKTIQSIELDLHQLHMDLVDKLLNLFS